MTNSGKVLWEKKFIIPIETSGNLRIASSDKGIVVFFVNADKPYTLLALKCDRLGNIEWKEILQPNQNKFKIVLIQALEDSENNYILFYQIDSLYDNPSELRILKINKQGEVLSFLGLGNLFSFQTSQHFSIRTIAETYTGGYIIGLSYQCSYCQSGSDGYLIVLNKSGEIISYKKANPGFITYEDDFTPMFITKHNGRYTLIGIYFDAAKASNDYKHAFYYCIASFNAKDTDIQAHMIPQDNFSLQRYLKEKMNWFEYQWQGNFKEGNFVVNSNHVFLAWSNQFAKYDSIGRVCPDYADTNYTYDTSTRKFYMGNEINFGSKVLDTISVKTKFQIKNYYVHWLGTICSGNELNEKSIENNNSELTEKQVDIFPNPATNFIYIKGIEDVQPLKFTCIDFMGNVQHINSIQPGSSQINISSLKHGIYLLKIETRNGTITKKFLKE